MERAARKVGVRRLSDFSRTAVYLGRRAEKQGQPDRAERAYDAALTPGRRATRTRSWRACRSWCAAARCGDALRSLPESATALLFRPRVARRDSLVRSGSGPPRPPAAALAGVILSLAVRHAPRVLHDIREAAFRFFGRSGALPARPRHRGLPAVRRLRAGLAHPLLGRAALGLHARAASARSSAPCSWPSPSSRRWRRGSRRRTSGSGRRSSSPPSISTSAARTPAPRTGCGRPRRSFRRTRTCGFCSASTRSARGTWIARRPTTAARCRRTRAITGRS